MAKVFIHQATERKIILAIYLPIRGDVWRMIAGSWMKGYMNSSVSSASDLSSLCVTSLSETTMSVVQFVLEFLILSFPIQAEWQRSLQRSEHPLFMVQ